MDEQCACLTVGKTIAPLGGDLLKEVIMRAAKNHMWSIENGAVLYAAEMLEWLETIAGIPRHEGQAVLTNWLSIIQHTVVSLAETDKEFLSALVRGEAILHLNNLLIPAGLDKDMIGNDISQQTNIPFKKVCNTIIEIKKKLYTIKDEKAFEPLGWLDVLTSEKRRGLQVYLWEDYLEPASYKFSQKSHASSRSV